MEQNNSTFEEAFAYLYFLMLSADSVADLAELEFGNKIIDFEEIDKTSTMKRIDFLCSQSREKVFEKGKEILKQLDRDEQLKCLAYIKLMSKSDGNVHTTEIDLINNLINNEFCISLKDISDVERKLEKQIAEYSSENV